MISNYNVSNVPDEPYFKNIFFMRNVLKSSFTVKKNNMKIKIMDSITTSYDDNTSTFEFPRHAQTIMSVHNCKNDIEHIINLLFINNDYIMLPDPKLFDGIIFEHYKTPILYMKNAAVIDKDSGSKYEIYIKIEYFRENFSKEKSKDVYYQDIKHLNKQESQSRLCTII
jgi:hypothetical protein